MATGIFVKNVYEKGFIDLFGPNLISSAIATGKYTRKGVRGDKVILDSLDDFTAIDYTGTLTYSELTNTDQTILLDQEKQIAKKLRSKDQWIKDVNLQDAARIKGVEAFGRDIDEYNLAQMQAGAGNTLDLEGVTLTATNILEKLFEPLVTIFNNNEVDEANRKLVVTPAYEAMIRRADIAQRTEGISGKGYFGSVMGIDVYQSVRLPANANTGSLKDLIALVPNAYAFEGSLNEVKILDSENFAGHALQMYMVYGGDVIDVMDKGVIKISFDETA